MRNGNNLEIKEGVVQLIGICGLAVLGAAGAAFGYQEYVWLKTGAWTSEKASDWLLYAGLPYPQTRWVGLQSLIDNALNTHVSFLLVLLGLGILVCAQWLASTWLWRRSAN